MTHPTPAEIRSHIAEALYEDQQNNPDDMMPIRTMRVVNKAITAACLAREAAPDYTRVAAE